MSHDRIHDLVTELSDKILFKRNYILSLWLQDVLDAQPNLRYATTLVTGELEQIEGTKWAQSFYIVPKELVDQNYHRDTIIKTCLFSIGAGLREYSAMTILY